jgi:ligand-binding SRPBCC domain-containing protein
MSNYILKRSQKLPITLTEAWEFFSAPGNLKVITPPYMGFEVISDSDSQKMYAGQIITYYVKPVFNLKLYWMTEITHVQEKHYFVDEQRIGPYALWHHTHFFEEIPGGVLIKDLVHYKLPFGPLGKLVHSLFVKKQLEDIFTFRQKVLKERFGVLLIN